VKYGSSVAANDLALFVVLVLNALFCSAAARNGLALQEAHQGVSRWELFAVGLFNDLPEQLCIFGLVTVVLLVCLVPFRRAVATRFRVSLFSLLFFLGLTLLGAVQVGLAEFRYQRGVYPTLYDLWMGLRSVEFIGASSPVFLLPRYLAFELVALAIAFITALLFWCRLVVWPRSFVRSLVLLLLLSATALGSKWAWLNSERIFPSISDHEVASSPYLSLRFSLGGKFTNNVMFGARTFVTLAAGHLASTPPDGRPLGLPQSPGGPEPMRCEHHPLRRPLPGNVWSAGSSLSSSQDTSFNAALVDALSVLSKQLFAEIGEPPVVWHIIAESFRGEDLNAINPVAPVELAPFVNRLYQQSTDSSLGVLASRATFESGTRTAQGISAAMCGLGSLPFQWAMLRDFGNLPFRCLPDVLVDAGFRGEAVKGASYEFDRQGAFFAYHGFGVVENRDMPANGPRGTWGYTDRFVFNHMAEAVVARQATVKPEYNVVVTLSNHGPNVRPDDLPDVVQQRVESVLFQKNMSRRVTFLDPDNRTISVVMPGSALDVDSSDIARLLTYSYTDFAIEEFVQRVRASSLGGRSIFVIHADHSTLDSSVWQAAGRRAGAGSLVPFVVLLPNGIFSAPHADVLRDALARVNDAFARRPISLDDVPTLLLALLSGSPQLASVAEGWRWHSMGGKTTSPFFAFPEFPSAVSWGLGATARLVQVGGDGTIATIQTPTRPAQVEADLDMPNSPLRGVAHFLSRFVSGYASSCGGAEWIRARASSSIDSPVAARPNGQPTL
jgi:hypothetical protein